MDSGRDVTIFSAISGGVLVTEGTGDSRLFFLIFEFYKMNKKKYRSQWENRLKKGR